MDVEPRVVALLAGLAVATATDLHGRRIPNALTFPLMAVGIGMFAIEGRPTEGLLGCAAAFALHFPLFALGIGRAGDAKLMMALGALLGWRGVVEATAWLAVLYVPVGVIVLALRGKLGNLVATGRHFAAKVTGGADPGPMPEQTWIPTGPVIAAAGAFTVATEWLALFP